MKNKKKRKELLPNFVWLTRSEKTAKKRRDLRSKENLRRSASRLSESKWLSNKMRLPISRQRKIKVPKSRSISKITR